MVFVQKPEKLKIENLKEQLSCTVGITKEIRNKSIRIEVVKNIFDALVLLLIQAFAALIFRLKALN